LSLIRIVKNLLNYLSRLKEMKKLLYLLALAMFIPAIASAQLLNMQEAAEKMQFDNAKALQTAIDANIDRKINTKATMDYLLESSSGFQPVYRTIETYYNGLFNITAYDYDPASNTMAFVHSTRISPQTDSGEVNATGRLRLNYSTNDGIDWETIEILNVEGEYFLHASLAIMNPTGSSNFEDLYFLAFSNHYDNTQESVPFLGGHVYVWSPVEEAQEFEYEGPFGTEGYKWSTQRMAVYNDLEIEESFAYHTGVLNPDEGYQYGRYGAGWVSNFLGADSWSPEQWRIELFRDPGTPNSSFNSPNFIDVDEDGNLYNVVFNMWADDDEFRTIGISKSTDQGVTWTDFERMPLSVWKDYRQLNGANITEFSAPNSGHWAWYSSDNFPGSSAAYQGFGFKVTGIDEFSVLMRQLIIRADTDYDAHLIEVKYSGGNWSINTVDNDLLGYYEAPRVPLFVYDTAGTGPQNDVLYQNPRGHEPQLATTADGNHVIAKWIKYANRYVIPGGAVPLVGNIWQIDTVDLTDVFFSYREVGSNKWNGPFNVTNDDNYFDKFTQIPSQVKDLRTVPLFKIHTGDTNGVLQSEQNRAYYPGEIREMVEEIVGLPYVMHANVDLTENWSGGKKIENPEPGNPPVPNVREIEFVSALGVYPNPADGDVTITFELEKAAVVDLEIHDAMGNLLAVIKRGEYYSHGTHNVLLNVGNLSSGAYFYTLRTENGSATRLLNVAK
jgi:hypothetical protein